MRDGSPCFLRAARQRAEQAHIIVVNHALLMADLERRGLGGGGLIPEYSHVIVDEAHHLEEAATNQFGFELPQGELERIWEPAARLATTVRMDLAAAPPEGAAADTGHGVSAAVEVEAPRIREAWEQLFAGLEILHSSQRRGRNQGDQNQLLITPDVRSHSAWAELHLLWENLDSRLSQAKVVFRNLRNFLETTRLEAEPDQQALSMEVASVEDSIAELAVRLSSVLHEAGEDEIHWLNVNPSQATLSLHSAPLDVGPILSEKLFAEKECVVLTSATLSAGGDFEYLKRRVGATEDASELLVGSPFDYERAAQVLIPEDMPQPNANGYVGAVTDVLSQLGPGAWKADTMALFTCPFVPASGGPTSAPVCWNPTASRFWPKVWTARLLTLCPLSPTNPAA